MDQARLPRTNTFAGLSRVLDRSAEHRDQAAWITARAHSDSVRYLLLDATGEAFLRRDSDTLRWLDAGEREQWFADAPASLLGMAHGRPHFLLVVDDPARIGTLETALYARRVSMRPDGLLPGIDQAALS